MWITIIIIAIAIGIIMLKKQNKESGGTTAQKTYSINSTEVCRSYSMEAIQFFDNYLTLCKNHSVLGSCNLLYIGKEYMEIHTKLNCTIKTIDDKNGAEAFGHLKNVWTQARQEKLESGDITGITSAGDSYIKEYFGCEDLHYVFTEADEYQFENGQVIMSFERPIFTREGAKWQPTLQFIKQEILKKWDDVTVDVNEKGIIVIF